ncbi:CheR family methyltransferase [Amantichitinum ursilacus]|uniref:protein-glutamate O-methyltransferase n=1 Tax=Amantichitinum ursilacus TaxID=857265 RepID=A0A0N0GM86_9NEIS|nr:protein-glutamate O-methyltransferase CheR [Amantichitinum ursilacus]KPC50695.1 Chemotaxis protein methyltransferase Cher2 [Amantichitinum ursilacus]
MTEQYGEPAIPITAEEYTAFRELFYRKTGIYFDDGRRYFVDRRLVACIREAGFTGFRGWYDVLRHGHPELMEAVINAMTVNETWFYREEYQFQALSQHILPEVLSRKKAGAPLRIWSIPCASGEEPYSIAMWLLENWPALNDVDIEIIASDIDTAMLQAAAAGVYTARAVHALPAEVRARYFAAQDDSGHYVLDQDVRDCVRFMPINVTDPDSVRQVGQVDVIFCRNLLIYFDEVSRRLAADHLFEVLAPGGYICLGHSESMSRISPLFRARRLGEVIVYQKPSGEG